MIKLKIWGQMSCCYLIRMMGASPFVYQCLISAHIPMVSWLATVHCICFHLSRITSQLWCFRNKMFTLPAVKYYNVSACIKNTELAYLPVRLKPFLNCPWAHGKWHQITYFKFIKLLSLVVTRNTSSI